MQETILGHDEDNIADFADNIDTLLVFVGANLFYPESTSSLRRDWAGGSLLSCAYGLLGGITRASSARQLATLRAAPFPHCFAKRRSRRRAAVPERNRAVAAQLYHLPSPVERRHH